MPRFLRVAQLLGIVAPIGVVACSFQNFDYLKGEYKSSVGGMGGSSVSDAGDGGASNAATGGGGGTTAGGALNRGGANNSNGGASGDGGADASLAGSADTSLAGSTGESGAGGEGGAPVVSPGVLLNPGFELGATGSVPVPDWTSVGDVDAATEVFADAHTGMGRLSHWTKSMAYSVSTSQVVSPLPNGKYTFSIWIKHSQLLQKEYIFARGYSSAGPGAQLTQDTMTLANDTDYTQIVLPHIPVTNGKCEVGVYTEGSANSSSNWSNIDDATLALEP